MWVAGFSCESQCLIDGLPWDSSLDREAASWRKELERLLQELEELENYSATSPAFG
jgi:hypothetical protein